LRFYAKQQKSGDGPLACEAQSASFGIEIGKLAARISTKRPPFANECRVENSGLYDQPGAILTQIYGSLNAKTKILSAKPDRRLPSPCEYQNL
jgi:hypothetical protein